MLTLLLYGHHNFEHFGQRPMSFPGTVIMKHATELLQWSKVCIEQLKVFTFEDHLKDSLEDNIHQTWSFYGPQPVVHWLSLHDLPEVS